MTGAVLAVRLDSDGDVLLTGPAIRALAHGATSVDLLVSPAGVRAAELLPGVRDVRVYEAPWSGYAPPALDPGGLRRLVDDLAARSYTGAVIFTSYHQSPLPAALVLRLAGVPHVSATCEDYPGSLLDVRHHRPGGLHEVEAALDLARASGYEPAAQDDGRLAVRHPLPEVSGLVPSGPYVVVHPGASVPARAPSPEHARAIVATLVGRGHRVVVTGGPSERGLGAEVAGARATDLSGRTSLAELAAVLESAACAVVGNTGPAHLAAAVGTPVVSLFAPVVPAGRWSPWGVPHVLLGDQDAPCRGTRARTCPVPGHPCLDGVTPAVVVDAVNRLCGARAGATGPLPRAVVA